MAHNNENVTVELLNDRVIYDPESGIFVWRVDVSKSIKAGSRAGTAKATSKNGKKYYYLRIDGQYDIAGARAAWALHYGEWPQARLGFHDDNPLNLRIANLYEKNYVPGDFDRNNEADRQLYQKEYRERNPLDWREGHLQATFGIGIQDYVDMQLAQKGVCAICHEAETATRNGKVKMLAVDHNHKTGAIRGLLCSDCNTGIGKLKDSVLVLESAIEYLKSHGS